MSLKHEPSLEPLHISGVDGGGLPRVDRAFAREEEDRMLTILTPKVNDLTPL